MARLAFIVMARRGSIAMAERGFIVMARLVRASEHAREGTCR
ncbi:MAG: hypothetical protein QOH05_135, partial [Acetobacteraceae bacterium]|nr:hypothetical protein [Acetobacteraceae bacterium]